MTSTIQLKPATPLLLITLALFWLAAIEPKAQAVSPPPDGGYPGLNTAEGDNALKSLNTAAGVGNTAVGWLSLFSDVEGGFNTAIGVGALALNTGGSNTGIGAAALILNTGGERNTAVGTGAMVNNNVGNDNTAVGDHALTSQTGEGPNTAVGSGALFSNTLGDSNTANGTFALFSNTEGSSNTASGHRALFSNDQGGGNTASGFTALQNNTIGGFNTANGFQALQNNDTGSANTAVGFQALFSNTSGSTNTALGTSAGAFVTTANNVICIGSLGANVSDSCFIANIRDVQTQNADAINVVIDSAGQLGTASSSRRFKEEIKPMDKASEAILALKPATFHYKSDKTGTPQFGLIAEEVAEVNPDLVVRDKNGEIYTVRHDAVNAMLLNEFLKEHRKVEEQEAIIAELKSTAEKQEATIARQQREFQGIAARQEKEIQALTADLKQQAAQLQKVSAQIELNRPTPQRVGLRIP
jgi:Chaperone of endosialidase